MAAAAASLQAMYPGRRVLRGMVDPAALGDAALNDGVFTLIAEGTSGWTDYTGREGQYGTLRFAVVGYVRVEDDAAAVVVEQAEAELEAELLAWCQAIKPEPLDAVYPKDVAYSRGLEAPVGWIVMALEALYV
jgi:hypothetical protein